MTLHGKETKAQKPDFKTSFLVEARKLGLVGAVAGPRDLGENRKRYRKRLRQRFR